MPSRYRAELSNPIRPGEVLLLQLNSATLLSFSVKGLKSIMSSIHYTVPTSSPESAVTQPGNGQDESFIPHFQKRIHHKGRMKEQRSQNKVVFVFFYFLFLK